jgi:hypothetical protein
LLVNAIHHFAMVEFSGNVALIARGISRELVSPFSH